MAELKSKIIELSNKYFDNVIKHRRIIHANPELSCQEFATSAYVCDTLGKLGIEYHKCTETGVVGIIGKGDDCIALRADIDALPIYEETGLEFASKNVGVMHACGHDMHTAILLGVAQILKEMESELNGTIKLIFQPSEELLPGGAIQMINAGVLENPRPKMVFGQHIEPSMPSGTLHFASGPVMASADEIYWTLRGKGSHAAQPHLGNDPISAAAAIINHFQTMLNKNKNPLKPAVLSIASINGGSATNIFPEEVKMKGTLRTFDDELRSDLQKLIDEHSLSISSLFGVDCEIEIRKGYPPLINDPIATDFAKSSAEKILSKEKVFDFEPKMWAEDFAYFAKNVPSVFWFLGAKPIEQQEIIPLHNSKLSPDEQAMINGVATMAFVAMASLK